MYLGEDTMSGEYFDTGNDHRIIFSINVLRNAIKLLMSKKIGELKRYSFENKMEEMLNLLNQIRYSYLPKKELVASEPFSKLIELASELYSWLMEKYRDLVKVQENTVKWLRFVLRNIMSLKERILNYPDKPSSAVQYCFVKVLSVIKHPKADKLWLTSVTDGAEKFDVITNDSSVRSNDVLLIAFLPPKEFGGIVSEGMFLGPDGIRKGTEKEIGASPELSQSEEKKILAAIYDFLRK